MDFSKIHKVYFIGIGGIGMSALARYFKRIGKLVAGYDKTPTQITSDLLAEGIFVHFNEELTELPDEFIINKEDTLIVFTPAVPKNHLGFQYLSNNGFKLYKRAEVLGKITNSYKTIAVAGTHGKTSISTATSWLFTNSNTNCLAFLGGISKNYNSNLVLPEVIDSECVAVVEADEFDRSFLQLSPVIALISAIDADHLDIYGNKENIVNSFNQFVKKIPPKGTIIYKKGLNLRRENLPEFCYTYAFTEHADYYAENPVKNRKGQYEFNLVTPLGTIEKLVSGAPGKINAENAVAAAALAHVAGLDENTIRSNLK